MSEYPPSPTADGSGKWRPVDHPLSSTRDSLMRLLGHLMGTAA